MRFNAPIISEQRLQRLHRWILLWLKWFAAFLTQAESIMPFSRQAANVAHGWLDIIERRVLLLITARVLPLLRPQQPPKHSPRRRKERQFQRAFVGEALRRALRAKDLRARIAKLSRDLAPLVARLAKRLRRGLTRRRPFIARPEAQCAEPETQTAPRVHAGDTS